MELNEEQFAVIGDPTELLVQEALFTFCAEQASTDAVAAKLTAMSWATSPADARLRIQNAIARAEVGVTLGDDGTAELWLDPITVSRIQRRHDFFVKHSEGCEYFDTKCPAAAPLVRTVVEACEYDALGDLPTWDQVVQRVHEEINLYSPRIGAIHIALLALDAGAVYLTGDPVRSTDVRVAVNTNRQETVES